MSVATAITATSTGTGALYGVISFIVWLLILVWIYNIARRKGRHAVVWLILGFFFSFLALILILLLPSKRTTETYRGS